MSNRLNEEFVQQLVAALRVPLSQGGDSGLMAVLSNRRSEDIAEAMRDLTLPESLALFNWLDNEQAAEVLSLLEPETTRYLLDNAPPGRVAELLDHLPADDAADVVSEADPEQAEAFLSDLSQRAPEDAAAVRELLAYEENTAGRLMTGAFVRLGTSFTVAQAMEAVRTADPEVEMLTDIYVVDQPYSENSRLLGVLSLRDLISAGVGQRLSDIMTTEVITVAVDTDQQEVARLIAKYDLLAMPVLDMGGFLVGIVTVDDVIDVMVEEFNEDIMRMVGSDAEEMDRRTPAQIARLRFPWLMGTMLIELFAGGVISRFDNVLREVILLASFMPVISAISGNVGLQAAAIVVRGLDTGHVSMRGWSRALRREMAASLLMALMCGLVLGGVGILWSSHLMFGVVVGIGMTCSMLTASIMGTMIPMLSKRLGFDPAATAGPFETAFQDVIGFGVFLWLASLLLPLLR
jgi:magnesium transporter